MPEGTASSRAAVFFDRDNTLMKVGSGYVGDPKDVVLMSDAAEAVAGARQIGLTTVVISNQSGVARGFFTENDVRAVNRRLDELLKARDRRAIVDRHEFCPHHPAYGVAPYRQACQCRKPRDGMLRRAASALKLDLHKSWLIGDAARDVEAGQSAGVRTILLTPPDVAPSPAASANARAQPDFRAQSLREALWIIARETGRQLPMMSAEEQELDELDEISDMTAQVELEEDALSLAEAHDDPVAPPSAVAVSAPAAPIWDDQPPLRPGAAAGPAHAATLPRRPPRQNLSVELAEEEPSVSPAQTLSSAPAPTQEREASRQEPAEGSSMLRILAGIVQVAALAIAVWASLPEFDQARLMLAIFAQLLALTLVSAAAK